MAESSHVPYYNDFLDDTFCHADGEYWPCLAYREASECMCRHAQSTHGQGGVGQCWSAACGCARFRLRVAA